MIRKKKIVQNVQYCTPLVQLEHLSCPIEYLPCIVNLFILAKFIYLFPFIFGNKEKRIKKFI